MRRGFNISIAPGIDAGGPDQIASTLDMIDQIYAGSTLDRVDTQPTGLSIPQEKNILELVAGYAVAGVAAAAMYRKVRG